VRAAEIAPDDRLVHYCRFCTAGADRGLTGYGMWFHRLIPRARYG
jgi:hypothetical protein